MPPKTKAQKAHTKSLSKAREALQRKKHQGGLVNENREGTAGASESTSISTAGEVKKSRGRKKAATEQGSSLVDASKATFVSAPLPVQNVNGQTHTIASTVDPQHIQLQPLQDVATVVPIGLDALDRRALMNVLQACQAELGYWRMQHPTAVAKVISLELENKRLRTELEVEKKKCANMMNGFQGLNLMVKSAARDYSQLLANEAWKSV